MIQSIIYAHNLWLLNLGAQIKPQGFRKCANVVFVSLKRPIKNSFRRCIMNSFAAVLSYLMLQNPGHGDGEWESTRGEYVVCNM